MSGRVLTVAAVSAALHACAYQPAIRDVGWRSLPIEEPAPQSVPRTPRLQSHLEAHRFTIAKDEDVVGALGTVQVRNGDTLSDVARHFGLGYEEIGAANPGMDPWVPPHQAQVVLPLRFVLPRAPRRGVVINLAAMRLFHYPPEGKGNEVVTYPVGIGREGKSTPLGAMSIARKKVGPAWYPTANIRRDHARRGDPLPAMVPPGPDNPLGAYAMYLSVSPYIIHGTNKPYSIGLRASNGCIRLYPENVERLFPTVKVKDSVYIVNQPYLIGWKEGTVYLQAHRPHEELPEGALKKAVRAELTKIAMEKSVAIDWTKVDRILDEALGIPFPITADSLSVEAVLADATGVRRPATYYGQPNLPTDFDGAWRVFAADTASEQSARRMAAVLTHQGPPIPARAVEKGERYQVIAGPFADATAARAAVRRLKVDLELDGQVIAPDTALAGAAMPEAVPAARPSEAPVTEIPAPDVAPRDAESTEWAYPEPEAAVPEPTTREPVTAATPAVDSAYPEESPTNPDVSGVLSPASEPIGKAEWEAVPEASSPETAAPTVIGPESISHDSAAPANAVPAETDPEGAETISPVTGEPDAGAAETTAPEAVPLDLTVPEAAYNGSEPEDGMGAPTQPVDSESSLESPPDVTPATTPGPGNANPNGATGGR